MTLQYNVTDDSLRINEEITWIDRATYYATKLGFQAPPGTTFQIIVDGGNSPNITMGPTGLYQLNLPNNLIKGFKLTSSTNFGILDVEVPGFAKIQTKSN